VVAAEGVDGVLAGCPSFLTSFIVWLTPEGFEGALPARLLELDAR
jgi:hypothetical protein